MQEFLEWKAFKERKLGFPAAPLAASGGGSSAYPLGLPRQLLPPRELDYNRLMDILLTKMSPVEESKHPGLYWLFKHLYIVLPASFRVTGKPHIGAHGETYMSFQFIADAPRARPVNFHAVGFYTTSPYRFVVRKIDIFMSSKGCGPEYRDAAVFTTSPDASCVRSSVSE